MPSGDQRAFAQFGALKEHTAPPIDVICTGFDPSALAIQISSQPERVDVNAMRSPSDGHPLQSPHISERNGRVELSDPR